jgi:hypothetical protein
MALKLQQKKVLTRSTVIDGVSAHRQNHSTLDKKAKGLRRAVGTALSLILGGTLCYVSLHYVPAFMNPPQVIAVTDFNTKTEHLKGNYKSSFMKAYVDAFNMKRAYIRKGQTIDAQYIVPKSNTLTLNITHCRPVPVIEVFDCSGTSHRNVVIENSPSGLRSFTFQEDGFYKFSESLTGPSSIVNDDKKRFVIWSRRRVAQ